MNCYDSPPLRTESAGGILYNLKWIKIIKYKLQFCSYNIKAVIERAGLILPA
ncbi:hypothetical protein CLOSYM_00656 [[Clostridium] symbiosum ATCC 14940]|uniref:Uncharacterized protein n=1 Tax=[Clostridium] symbiosum ATCC 14940 TaxID=411472 RepID=A0ABC9U2D4_CLOSY|nr:hypothetical protein CLOSYM_00656 [[Clostridium] symbiosum ATCC 14940]